jgi:hypothetical protein
MIICAQLLQAATFNLTWILARPLVAAASLGHPHHVESRQGPHHDAPCRLEDLPRAHVRPRQLDEAIA